MVGFEMGINWGGNENGIIASYCIPLTVYGLNIDCKLTSERILNYDAENKEALVSRCTRTGIDWSGPKAVRNKAQVR